MLVVSHEMRFAREAADRVAFMEAGQIVEIGTPAEILARGAESRAFNFSRTDTERWISPVSSISSSTGRSRKHICPICCVALGLRSICRWRS